jgi:antitoxin (DNA-binding transcriptional repressor) of toxin-antitoxin stability system
MTTEAAQIGQHVDEMIRGVRSGERVEILFDDEAVAELVMPEHFTTHPDGEIIDQTEFWVHIEDLIARGIMKRGTGKLPDDFFTRELPRAKESVLQQLLDDRHSD